MSDRIEELEKVLSSRGDQYGNFADIALLSSTLRERWVYTFDVNTDVTASTLIERGMAKEAATMILHKLSRIAIGDPTHRDSWMDIAGYALRTVMELDRLKKAREWGV